MRARCKYALRDRIVQKIVCRPADDMVLLTEEEAAELSKTDVRTFRWLRSIGMGPEHLALDADMRGCAVEAGGQTLYSPRLIAVWNESFSH